MHAWDKGGPRRFIQNRRPALPVLVTIPLNCAHFTLPMHEGGGGGGVAVGQYAMGGQRNFMTKNFISSLNTAETHKGYSVFFLQNF